MRSVHAACTDFIDGVWRLGCSVATNRKSMCLHSLSWRKSLGRSRAKIRKFCLALHDQEEEPEEVLRYPEFGRVIHTYSHTCMCVLRNATTMQSIALT